MRKSDNSVFSVAGQAGQNRHRKIFKIGARLFGNVLLAFCGVFGQRDQLSFNRLHHSANRLDVASGVFGQLDNEGSHQHFKHETAGEKLVCTVLRHLPGSRFLREPDASTILADNARDGDPLQTDASCAADIERVSTPIWQDAGLSTLRM